MLVSWEISLGALVVGPKGNAKKRGGCGLQDALWDKFLSSRARSAPACPAEATTIFVDCPLGTSCQGYKSDQREIKKRELKIFGLTK